MYLWNIHTVNFFLLDNDVRERRKVVSLRSMAVLKVGEGRETARRLGQEQLEKPARSRAFCARISRLRHSCPRLDKTAMLHGLESRIFF